MISSFYPSTIYAKQDDLKLVWELEKENSEQRKQIKRLNLIIRAFENSSQVQENQLNLLQIKLNKFENKRLKEFF